MTRLRARARDLARFVVNIGVAPADYWRLTVYERDAIVGEFNRVHRKKK